MTSALSNTGIDRLFESIGKKILDRNYNEDGIKDLSNSIPKKKNANINNNKGRNTVKLTNQNDNVKNKKKCMSGGHQ